MLLCLGGKILIEKEHNARMSFKQSPKDQLLFKFEDIKRKGFYLKFKAKLCCFLIKPATLKNFY